MSNDFKPFAFYNRDGDMIEVIAGPDAYYGEYVDEHLTLYYSQDTGELVGCEVTFVESLKRKAIATRIPSEDELSEIAIDPPEEWLKEEDPSC